MTGSRGSKDFVPADLGVRATRALCDRFGAQVTEYSADGTRSSVTVRLPSRRELLQRSMARARITVAAATAARRRAAANLEASELARTSNLALREALTETRSALTETRGESKRILSLAAGGSTSRRGGP